MKISILHYSCPPLIGGVERVVEAHARKFLEFGHGVKLVVGRGKRFCPSIPVSVIPEMRSLRKVDRAAHEEITAGKAGSRFEAVKNIIYRKLRGELSSSDVCIVHNALTMHFNLALTAALDKLARETREVKFVSWIHDTSLNDPAYGIAGKKGYPWDMLRTHNESITQVAISKYRRDKTAALFKISRSGIKVIPNGIDPVSFLKLGRRTHALFNRLGLYSADFVFLYPARIIRRKNIEFAVRIVRELNASGSDARLLLTSQPDPHNDESRAYFRKIKDLASELDAEDSVIFISGVKDESGRKIRVDGNMLRDLYLMSDVLLFTSSAEGFGIPVLEAGICKLPVACTFIPPLEEIAGDTVIYLDPRAAVEKTAERLRSRLEGNPTLGLFRKVMREYTWDAVFREKIIPFVEKQV